jgi:dihydroorotate dehydrogenase electron transfer subunit
MEFKSHGVGVEISTDDGSYGHAGFVTELLRDKLETLDRSREIRVYSCGPHPMMKAVASICEKAGIPGCQVSLENNMACGIGVCTGCVQKIKGAAEHDDSGRGWHYERVCKDGPVFYSEDIIWE